MTKEQIINQYISVYEGHAMEKEELEIMLNGFADDIVNNLEHSLPDNLDDAAREIVIKMHSCLKDCTILGDRLTRGQLIALVKAGAEWMAGQGEKQEHFVIGHTEASHGVPVIVCYPKSFEIGDEVEVILRKKQ